MTTFDIKQFVSQTWDESIVPKVSEYIAIPNQSPDYDPEWATNGLQEKAIHLLLDWVHAQPLVGATVKLLEEPGKTPFMHINVAPTAGYKGDGHILMYGHMDKQPPMLPWAEGLDPYIPVLRDGKLYGRGGADDGYAVFAAVTSIVALQKAGIPHAHITVVIEAAEESGSDDLPHWIDKIRGDIGDIDLVLCLDSGAATYDRLWLTNSLRGTMNVVLKIETLTVAMHSGLGGGVVPDVNRILRVLLDRLEDSATGEIKVKSMHVPLPESARVCLEALNDIPRADFMKQYPFLPGVHAEPDGTNADLTRRTTWMPSITLVGYDGVPEVAKGGNVLRTAVSVKLSCRLPPGASPAAVGKEIKALLEADVPHGAHVTVTLSTGASAGWTPKELQPWLVQSLNKSSTEVWGKGFGAYGIGGAIPFMTMLGEMFPRAQFVVTGVLGPESNAHGPNEFLHVDFGKGVTRCVIATLRDHAMATATA